MGRYLDIRLLQVGYDARDIRHHVEKIKGLIAEHRQADLLVFPELCLHGHPSLERPEGFLYRKMRVAYGPISTDLYRFVRDVGARVVIGEMQRKGDELFNVATYLDDERAPQHYVKTHVHWTEHFVPGRALRTFETPFGPLGVNICFDAAFPEVWRTLALLGAEVIVNLSAVPASFPSRYVHRRMSAAALNNQVFVVYANRPGPVFSGESAVFDPRGETLAGLGPDEGTLRVRLDREQVARWREQEPLWPHRRPQLYRPVTASHWQGRRPQFAGNGQERGDGAFATAGVGL